MTSSFHVELLNDQDFYFFVHQFYLNFESADETTVFTRKYNVQIYGKRFLNLDGGNNLILQNLLSIISFYKLFQFDILSVKT